MWFLGTLGFLYLAADELFDLHSEYDRAIHRFLHIQESGLTDRLDDLLIFVYIMAALFVVYLEKKEFALVFRTPRVARLFYLALSAAIIHVIFDMLSNRKDIARWLCQDQPQLDAKVVHSCFSLLEQITELSAELAMALCLFLLLRQQFLLPPQKRIAPP